jgi:hypothetical protein
MYCSGRMTPSYVFYVAWLLLRADGRGIYIVDADFRPYYASEATQRAIRGQEGRHPPQAKPERGFDSGEWPPVVAIGSRRDRRPPDLRRREHQPILLQSELQENDHAGQQHQFYVGQRIASDRR